MQNNELNLCFVRAGIFIRIKAANPNIGLIAAFLFMQIGVSYAKIHNQYLSFYRKVTRKWLSNIGMKIATILNSYLINEEERRQLRKTFFMIDVL
ncbi:hypothetical protein [Neobacillus mesonae]|uniref:hypothetical protein n=1 Tax=Neobacillus mesonae TaxID=1193713 RepID=UPI002572C4B9|nr:hypothetical protein [Neobacillus mesonae]MED4207596.1 hypothetical protein [Neobacillus mesonae]